MEHEFWHERWRNAQIGFHQPQGNPLLRQHWPDLGIPPESDVFVPLCGKSRDMAWLAQRGHRVVGCELSARAVEAFFREQNLEPRVEAGKRFTRYAAGPFTLLCGDFFQIEVDDLSPATALYDRAALIAMPESMRDAYAGHLLSLLAAGCAGIADHPGIRSEQDAGPAVFGFRRGGRAAVRGALPHHNAVRG